MKNEYISEELISFVREESGEFNMDISELSSIEIDLGITGDDAIELIKKYANKFNVNLEGFQFGKYFYDEPSMFSKYKKIKIITVGHLKKGIELGVLNDNVINEYSAF